MADRAVTLEQPTANKVIVFSLAAAAAFIALILGTKIEATGFVVMLGVFVLVVFAYTYRSLRIAAIARSETFAVRNLLRDRVFRWREIDVLAVTRVGTGTGIVVELHDGTSYAIEASWGPWYQGKQAAANTKRCETFIARVDAMRSGLLDVADAEEEPVDPIEVRTATPDDAAAVASIIDEAWRETYAGILVDQVLHGRNVAEDSEMVRRFTEGDIPGGGCLVATYDGTVVGASVWGPPGDPQRDGAVEVYMLYVLADHVGTAVSRRLTARTYSAVRGGGATSICFGIHSALTALRSRVTSHGAESLGPAVEQVWYGIPVRIHEYAWTSTPGGGGEAARPQPDPQTSTPTTSAAVTT